MHGITSHGSTEGSVFSADSSFSDKSSSFAGADSRSSFDSFTLDPVKKGHKAAAKEEKRGAGGN